MCGIAAIVSDDTRRDELVQRMLGRLRHRGPDGEGIHHDRFATLGHRRLSIIDLAGGHQPLSNADGSVWLVCNGEIYDHQEHRARIEREGGYSFRTGSDCELILALYERHGDRLLEHLRGMFAFVLWDSKRRRLLAARDHLGQKPLYYTYGANGFACASEIKSLLEVTSSRPKMNLAALDQYFALRVIDAPLSMFEGVHKLPPGHSLVLEAGQPPRIQRYWSAPSLPKLEGTVEELVDALEAELEQALRLHMVSDVPVGAFLSGGLDSSLLVAMMARKLGTKDLQTFTIGLEYQRFDEAPAARAVAKLFETRHREERVLPHITAALPELVTALDEPSDPLSLCTWLLAQLASRNVKVVIGGDGGDELFGGYDRYFGNLYARHFARVPAILRRGLMTPVMALLPESGWYKSVGHQLRWLEHLASHEGSARYAASLNYFYFDREQRAELFSSSIHEQWAHLDAEAAVRTPYDAGDGDALDRMLRADREVRLPNHPVMITDRICMAHGLEARSPYMDHKLVEFAARLPGPLKVRGTSLRYIQRRLAQRYLPESILRRPKQGFASALPYLLQREFSQLHAVSLQHSRLVEERILEPRTVRRLIDEHTSRRADHGHRLWLLINAELWYRLMIDGQSTEDLRHDLLAERPAARRRSIDAPPQPAPAIDAV
ncbi:MAG: asparagine synthase (glutamine-hydrolyzing) [Povalibacter sp.]